MSEKATEAARPPVEVRGARGWPGKWRGDVMVVDRPGDLSSVRVVALCPHLHRKHAAAVKCAESLPSEASLFGDARRCAVCGDPLPAGSRRQRRFCSGRCRVSHQRGAPEYERLEVTGETVTSKPAEESDPASASVEPDFGPSMSVPGVQPAAPLALRGLAAIAAGIATPADAYGPARAYCEVRGGGHGVVFGLDAGRRPVAVGPVFERPRQAIDLADLLNGRIATPA